MFAPGYSIPNVLSVDSPPFSFCVELVDAFGNAWTETTVNLCQPTVDLESLGVCRINGQSIISTTGLCIESVKLKGKYGRMLLGLLIVWMFLPIIGS